MRLQNLPLFMPSDHSNVLNNPQIIETQSSTKSTTPLTSIYTTRLSEFSGMAMYDTKILIILYSFPYATHTFV